LQKDHSVQLVLEEELRLKRHKDVRVVFINTVIMNAGTTGARDEGVGLKEQE
jgi:hypothetical protein